MKLVLYVEMYRQNFPPLNIKFFSPRLIKIYIQCAMCSKELFIAIIFDGKLIFSPIQIVSLPLFLQRPLISFNDKQ